MYYVPAYVRMHLCMCVCRQSACTCLSVGMNVVMHSACAQASVRLSVCMLLRVCIRSRVYGFECMSVLGTCLHTCLYI